MSNSANQPGTTPRDQPIGNPLRPGLQKHFRKKPEINRKSSLKYRIIRHLHEFTFTVPCRTLLQNSAPPHLRGSSHPDKTRPRTEPPGPAPSSQLRTTDPHAWFSRTTV